MLDKNKWAQYGEEGLVIKGITIHNSSLPLTAKEIFDDLNNSNLGSNCFHFVIDKNEVIQLMPLNWKVYNTGKGKDSSFRYTISILIANALDEESIYLESQNRAIELIKNLMNTYNLTVNEIYFHNDFNNQAYCPQRILQIYKTKEKFIKEVF